MKKYKLIKEYPGSPKLGIEVVKMSPIDASPNKKDLYKIPNGRFLECEEVEKYPEFWQEVSEKEYEILSIIQHQTIDWISTFRLETGKFTLESRYAYDKTVSWTLEELLKAGGKIHSIKRLSDGEVFTVGDKINGTHSVDENIKLGPGYTTINGFYLNESSELEMRISTGYSNIDKFKDGMKPFSKYTKYIPKTPLFTTEDGVDIFENKGQYFPIVNPSNYNLGSCQMDSYVQKNPKSYGIKIFSTKEAAEEYIIMNKPCLSLKDIRHLDPNKYAWEALIKLVKSKL